MEDRCGAIYFAWLMPLTLRSYRTVTSSLRHPRDTFLFWQLTVLDKCPKYWFFLFWELGYICKLIKDSRFMYLFIFYLFNGCTHWLVVFQVFVELDHTLTTWEKKKVDIKRNNNKQTRTRFFCWGVELQVGTGWPWNAEEPAPRVDSIAGLHGPFTNPLRTRMLWVWPGLSLFFTICLGRTHLIGPYGINA